MGRHSAGLLVYRWRRGDVEVLLVHPGGPFWAKKDRGAWSIPKGEYAPGEDALEAARREFTEETGWTASGPFIPLRPVRQAGGKVVTAWAVEADVDASSVRSNTFSLEWPPRSGRQIEVPEIDRAEWFSIPNAEARIGAGQRPLLAELIRLIENMGDDSPSV
jgi:predicted NUDIX family NTP pyrophosphohydrolase